MVVEQRTAEWRLCCRFPEDPVAVGVECRTPLLSGLLHRFAHAAIIAAGPRRPVGPQPFSCQSQRSPRNPTPGDQGQLRLLLAKASTVTAATSTKAVTMY